MVTSIRPSGVKSNPTGSVAPYVRTADICSMIFSFSRIRIVESSLNDSTQSPA